MLCGLQPWKGIIRRLSCLPPLLDSTYWHNCHDLRAAGYPPCEVVVRILARCFSVWTYIAVNFSTTQVRLWKATRNLAGLCVGLPWLHIGMDEKRLSWLPCCRVLSSSDISRGGGWGGGGESPCRALMWVQCASMGIRCCTPIMTNIFRRHSLPRCVLWVRVQVAFSYSNPLT